MKKIIMIISLVIFLFLMPSGISVSTSEKMKCLSVENLSSDPEEAPGWAIGNFTGVFGIDIWGHDLIPIGCLEGYFGKGFHGEFKFGRLQIEYIKNDEENGTILEGLFFGPFLLGQATDISSDEKVPFCGIGEYNETNFSWRVMASNGPTLYMKGTFSEF